MGWDIFTPHVFTRLGRPTILGIFELDNNKLVAVRYTWMKSSYRLYSSGEYSPPGSQEIFWDLESFIQRYWVDPHVYKKVKFRVPQVKSQVTIINQTKLSSSPSYYNGLLHPHRLLHHRPHSSRGLISTHQRGERRIWRIRLLCGCISIWRSSSILPSNYHHGYVSLLFSKNSFTYQILSRVAYFRLSRHIFMDLTRGDLLHTRNIWRYFIT